MFLLCCSFFTIFIRMGDIKWISPQPKSKTFYPPRELFSNNATLALSWKLQKQFFEPWYLLPKNNTILPFHTKSKHLVRSGNFELF